MKAGIHIALFITTVYSYFFPKNKADEPQPDNPYHADIENDNTDGPIHYGKESAQKYNTQQPKETTFAELLYPDPDQESDQLYTRFGGEEQQKVESGIVNGVKRGFGKFWIGSQQIMSDYAKARTDLNSETIEASETLTEAKKYISQKTQNAHKKITHMMYARRLTQQMKSQFGDEFNTL